MGHTELYKKPIAHLFESKNEINLADIRTIIVESNLIGPAQHVLRRRICIIARGIFQYRNARRYSEVLIPLLNNLSIHVLIREQIWDCSSVAEQYFILQAVRRFYSQGQIADDGRFVPVDSCGDLVHLIKIFWHKLTDYPQRKRDIPESALLHIEICACSEFRLSGGKRTILASSSRILFRIIRWQSIVTFTKDKVA